jgi:hypothetical protein
MEPLISIQFRDHEGPYRPGDPLVCEYQIDAVDPGEIVAVEASVLWYTEGKGDEDFGVHYFERRAPADADEGDLRPLRRFRTALPDSPLSYEGTIVKVRWCARVRLYLARGRELTQEIPFQLGDPAEVAHVQP